MKKVCFISHSAELYGAPKSLLLLLENINQDDVKIFVVCFGDGPLVEKLKQMEIPVHVIISRAITSRSSYLINKLNVLFQLLRVFIKHWPGLVYVNTVAKTTPILAAWLLRIRVIVHVRESQNYFKSNSKAAKIKLVIKTKLPMRYICVSNSVKHVLLNSRVRKDKITVIYNGIDSDALIASDLYRNDIRKELGISDEEIVVGYVGQLIERKGIEFLVEVANAVLNKVSHCRFVLLGGPINSNYMVEKVMPLVSYYGLDNKIIIKDFISDIRAYYSAFDIFILTAQEDPFPRVNLEAMSTSLPIVATTVGGNPEAIIDGYNGYLVQYGDVDTFSSRIFELLRDEQLRNKMGCNGRNRVEKEFSLQKYIDRVLEEVNNVYPVKGKNIG